MGVPQENPDEVCPAGWQPGSSTMKPDPVGCPPARSPLRLGAHALMPAPQSLLLNNHAPRRPDCQRINGHHCQLVCIQLVCLPAAVEGLWEWNCCSRNGETLSAPELSLRVCDRQCSCVHGHADGQVAQRCPSFVSLRGAWGTSLIPPS